MNKAELDYKAQFYKGLKDKETDTQIALRKIEECIEMSRKETNTMYTLPLLSEVINRLQQEE